MTLTLAACTNGVTSGVMHAREYAVISRQCIEGHVPGVGDTSLGTGRGHNVIQSFLEDCPH